eukprot:TRINITY_DN6908_c0_g1_i1.p2 TRINITY_DN6908_c0_g1~~TRINITY_DN6908_c0_g1_i1.p2  ORF type:complete len:181 (-),score=19.05 TRINITY_DN6908_c0_g1_i1:1159-1701(-)
MSDDYLRPVNQSTKILSGVVSDPVVTLLDKIQIESGTVISAYVSSPWEVSFPPDVFFVVNPFWDYYAYDTFVFSGKPVDLGNTNVHLIVHPVPNHQYPRSSVQLVRAQKILSSFAIVQQNNSNVECHLDNIRQEIDSNSHLSISYNLTCTRECVISTAGMYRMFYTGMGTYAVFWFFLLH